MSAEPIVIYSYRIDPAGVLRTLSFGHDPSYYMGSDWTLQMRGMQGYFSRFPETPDTVRIMLLIQSFGDVPLSRASAERIGAATSAAMERHLAANWLTGGSELYSETDVST